MLMKGKATKTIRQSVFIEATPKEVYEALTDAKKHSEFTGSRATGDAVEGEGFTAWDGYIYGKHVRLEKGKRIVQEWRTTEWPADASPSNLTFTLKPSKGGTLLKMVHSKVPSEQAEAYDKGWDENYWEPLKRYFEKRTKPAKK